jgi:hypothetical protein
LHLWESSSTLFINWLRGSGNPFLVESSKRGRRCYFPLLGDALNAARGHTLTPLHVLWGRAAPLPHHAGRFATWGASLSSQLSLLVMLFPNQRGTGRENPYEQPTAPGTSLSTPSSGGTPSDSSPPYLKSTLVAPKFPKNDIKIVVGYRFTPYLKYIGAGIPSKPIIQWSGVPVSGSDDLTPDHCVHVTCARNVASDQEGPTRSVTRSRQPSW